jgi:hypothetical protein
MAHGPVLSLCQLPLVFLLSHVHHAPHLDDAYFKTGLGREIRRLESRAGQRECAV